MLIMKARQIELELVLPTRVDHCESALVCACSRVLSFATTDALHRWFVQKIRD